MSEPGNKSIKPTNTVRLVTAAIYDVAHMVYQERQLHFFNRNLLKCTRRGLTKEAHDARDRAQQMRKAEEFAAIFDDEDAVLLETEEQAMNPNSYLQCQNDIHRAPKDKKVGKGRGKKTEEKKKEKISINKDVPKKVEGEEEEEERLKGWSVMYGQRDYLLASKWFLKIHFKLKFYMQVRS